MKKEIRMKKLLPYAASALLLGATGLAFAQDNAPATTSAPETAPSAQSTPMAEKGMKGTHPKLDELRTRLKLQRARIEEGVKNGKLTAQEAEALRAKVKAVHDQMRADFEQNKQSRQKGLTDDQFSQLNQMLDENSKAIFNEKNPESSSPSDNADSNAATAESAPSSAASTQSSQ
jgi:hypothetical protein